MFLPFWFYLGVILNLVGWVVSWSHIAPWSSYMYIFIWGGFILILDGLNYRIKSSSLLSRNPRAFVFICLISSLFWWYFELVNMITRNWYYVIDIPLSPLMYQFLASLYFMTVIPVIFEITELIHFRKLLGTSIRWIKAPEHFWIYMLIAGILSIALPVWNPRLFFPLMWIAPALILDSVNYRLGHDSLLGDVVQGEWARLLHLAVAAFITGFFWELWNLYADPKWVYEVPIVGFAKIFEMPVIGFLGYLPFGWSVFSFYAFIQGIFKFPQRKFFVESEYSFKPLVHNRYVIIVVAVAVCLFSLRLAQADIDVNTPLHNQTPFVINDTDNHDGISGTKFRGDIQTCHYGFIEGRCLYSGVGKTYWLTGFDKLPLNVEMAANVEVIGTKEDQPIGLSEIRVSKITRLD